MISQYSGLVLLGFLVLAAAHPHEHRDISTPYASFSPTGTPLPKPSSLSQPYISQYPNASNYPDHGPTVSPTPAASGNATILNRDDLPRITGAVNEAENALRVALHVEFYMWKEFLEEWNKEPEKEKEKERNDKRYPRARVSAAFLSYFKSYRLREHEPVYFDDQVNITSSKTVGTCKFADCAVRLYIVTNRVVRWDHAGLAIRKLTNYRSVPGFGDIFNNRTADWVLTKHKKTGFIFDIPLKRAELPPSPSPLPLRLPKFQNVSLLPDISSVEGYDERAELLAHHVEYHVWDLQRTFSKKENKRREKEKEDGKYNDDRLKEDPKVLVEGSVISLINDGSDDIRIENSYPQISGVQDTITTIDGYKIYEMDEHYSNTYIPAVSDNRKNKAKDICKHGQCATRLYVESEIFTRWKIIQRALDRTRKQNSFKKVYSENRRKYIVKKFSIKVYTVDIPFSWRITQLV